MLKIDCKLFRDLVYSQQWGLSIVENLETDTTRQHVQTPGEKSAKKKRQLLWREKATFTHLIFPAEHSAQR